LHPSIALDLTALQVLIALIQNVVLRRCDPRSFLHPVVLSVAVEDLDLLLGKFVISGGSAAVSLAAMSMATVIIVSVSAALVLPLISAIVVAISVRAMVVMAMLPPLGASVLVAVSSPVLF
jgi:hypothetical protein